MKGLILLANYFEDVEALITIDMLRRAKITIDLVSVTKEKQLITQSNLAIMAEKTIDEVCLDDYDFVVLPGGKAVFETHLTSSITNKVIEHFMNKNKLVCAICAAPKVLSKYLENKDFTCFPSCEDDILGNYTANKVEVVGNIITSKAAGTTFDFAYEIIKYLENEELAKKVINSVYYK